MRTDTIGRIQIMNTETKVLDANGKAQDYVLLNTVFNYGKHSLLNDKTAIPYMNREHAHVSSFVNEMAMS